MSYSDDYDEQRADAKTLVTLLHLRDIESNRGESYTIVSEMLDVRNRALAAVTRADDFIVSNTLVSLMVSQVAENPHLVSVFDELFSSQGYEIYLKPAGDYVKPGRHTFGVLCEAALRRNEIAIGYRLAKSARDPHAAYGVKVNPSKREKLRFAPDDKVIVLAEA